MTKIILYIHLISIVCCTFTLCITKHMLGLVITYRLRLLYKPLGTYAIHLIIKNWRIAQGVVIT